MKNKIENKMGYLVAGSMVLGSLLIVGTAFAAGPGMNSKMGGHIPGVFGTVSYVNGNIITVTSKSIGQSSTTTTYNIDATNAKVTKAGVSTSVSNIIVGDKIMVQGTVNGTNVAATVIRDGVMQGTQGTQGAQKARQNVTPVIKGNGQPIVGGNVTSVNGSIITITNKSNVTYTVDATNATVQKANASSSVSAITIGDSVVAQGTVNGNSVVATSVMDGGSSSSTTVNGTPSSHQGGGVINFFRGLFGFF